MCLIIAKSKGLPFPPKSDMKRWFNKYPDGVGIAFQEGDRVRVIKGAMSRRSMHKLVSTANHYIHKQGKQMEDVDLIIQFRAAVTGKVCKEFCHPFPISPNQADLDSLNVVTNAALAHNGVISMYSNYYSVASVYTYYDMGDVNDAQEFIKDYICHLDQSTLTDPTIMDMISTLTYSKFALLDASGIHYMGKFIEDGGYYYSNDGYKPYVPKPVGTGLPTGVTVYRSADAGLDVRGWQEANDTLPQERVRSGKIHGVMEECEVCGDWNYPDEMWEYAEMHMCDQCYRYYTNPIDASIKQGV